MTKQDRLPMRFVAGFNKLVLRLRASRRWGGAVRKRITIVTYTGRRSGRTFTTPVGYTRTGDTVLIKVMMPDRKSWWRNFTGDGGHLSLELDGANRPGHATARRAAKGQVEVTVHLDRAQR